ncbi:helix-turn-helix domain-containing protein [Pararoseomonas indoligenes]|uniref:Helix-turn-helix transcriptional regulator n=1 Tax=Roseomonas indoligenes TaxID=2820811 RepID=A0A940MUP7_9PROT|nr:XRE family transcriptional regulator [Pararoseomonas indoligenes]MBP0494478.1 helix-turn-helix transcriptional regulator [Pararoseomonas indoligenes]
MTEAADLTAGRPSLGECVRAARQSQGLTLKEVSARSGLAISTLSKVENGQMSLTYDKLLALSEGLRVSVATLFEAPSATRPVTARRSISRAGGGRRLRTDWYEYLYQFTDIARKRMIPIMAELHARSIAEFGDLIRHTGEEYCYVLEGKVEVHTEFYEPDLLEPGDGIYLDSTMGHAYLNAGEGAARAIVVCSGIDPDLDAALIALLSGRLRGAASS